jgi:hypothetical protein
MKPSFEAPDDFGVYVEFLPSLEKIIIGPYVLVHFCNNYSGSEEASLQNTEQLVMARAP